jgi:hypothetical protein
MSRCCPAAFTSTRLGRLHPIAKEFIEHHFKLAWRHGQDASSKFARFQYLAGVA